MLAPLSSELLLDREQLLQDVFGAERRCKDEGRVDEGLIRRPAGLRLIEARPGTPRPAPPFHEADCSLDVCLAVAEVAAQRDQIEVFAAFPRPTPAEFFLW